MNILRSLLIVAIIISLTYIGYVQFVPKGSYDSVQTNDYVVSEAIKEWEEDMISIGIDLNQLIAEWL